MVLNMTARKRKSARLINYASSPAEREKMTGFLSAGGVCQLGGQALPDGKTMRIRFVFICFVLLLFAAGTAFAIF